MQKGAGHYFFWGGGRMLGLSPRLAPLGLERIESVTINGYVPASSIVPCSFFYTFMHAIAVLVFECCRSPWTRIVDAVPHVVATTCNGRHLAV